MSLPSSSSSPSLAPAPSWRWMRYLLSFILLFFTFLHHSQANTTTTTTTTVKTVNKAKITTSTTNLNLEEIEEREFDWIAYLDMNLDLQAALTDQQQAWSHYKHFGKKEGRWYPRKLPEYHSLALAEEKVNAFLSYLNVEKVPYESRTLCIYFLPSLYPEESSLEMVLNNVKIFTSAIQSDLYYPDHHDKTRRKQMSSNLYWINAINPGKAMAGSRQNPLLRYFPSDAGNVIIANWALHFDQELITLRTLAMLHQHDIITTYFHSVFFLDGYTRGPFSYRHNGEWLSIYRNLLNHYHVGLAGTTISCELTPHVQNYSYIIRSSAVPIMLNAFNLSYPYQQFRGTLKYNLQYFSVIMRKIYNISSILHYHYGSGGSGSSVQQQQQQVYFNGQCMAVHTKRSGANRLSQQLADAVGSATTTTATSAASGGSGSGSGVIMIPEQQVVPEHHTVPGSIGGGGVGMGGKGNEHFLLDPLRWCGLNLSQMIFYPWGGSRSLTMKHPLCKQMKFQMYDLMTSLQEKEPQLNLQVPETAHGGLLHDLFYQYEEEIFQQYLQQRSRKGYGGVVNLLGHLQSMERLSASSSSAGRLLEESGGSSGGGGETKVDTVNTLEKESRGGAGGSGSVGGSSSRLLMKDQVCLLVRSSASYYEKNYLVNRNTSLLERDSFYSYNNLIQSLLRQRDPHWTAFFYLIDSHQTFGPKLRLLIDQYHDPRLQFIRIRKRGKDLSTMSDLPAYCTDYVLQKVVQESSCSYIAVTNAINIYGSSVISNVRQSLSLYLQSYPILHTAKDEKQVEEKEQQLNHHHQRLHQVDPVDIFIAPMDSKDFMYKDHARRHFEPSAHGLCVSLIVSLHVNILGYLADIRPSVEEIPDIASVFFSRKRLLDEFQHGLHYGNLSSSLTRIMLDGSKNGHDRTFLHHLLDKRHWRAVHLPVDGLKSMVFSAPSPLWCIASGQTWFGHPLADYARCYSKETVREIALADGSTSPNFEWANPHLQICLHLNGKGFASVMHNKEIVF